MTNDILKSDKKYPDVKFENYVRIAHEAPLDIFHDVAKRTHYDYYLVHLFDTLPEYKKLAMTSNERGRESILDNSIFELGTAFDAIKYRLYIEKMKPTWYIVPDALEDYETTMTQMRDWKSDGYYDHSKSIGVVQGKTYDELVDCYRYMAENNDMIAISFDLSYYETRDDVQKYKTKLEKWCYGRQMTLYDMYTQGIINRRMPHHLLGCSLPQEFAFYRHWVWIDSIDTSNPVMAGIKDMEYERQPEYDIWGLDDKPTQKLYTIINDDVDDKTFEKIKFNIEKFDYNINGWG